MIVMFISMNTGNNQCHRVKSEKFALKPKAKKKKKKKSHGNKGPPSFSYNF